MVRLASLISALLFLPAGLVLLFLPAGVSDVLGISPLWLVRVVGALVSAWGAQHLVGALRPSLQGVVGLILGNLLVAAVLVPAALRSALVGTPRNVALLVGALLLLLALGVLLAPGSRRELDGGQVRR